MFTLTVQTQFRASHQVCLPDGPKEPLHEHDWKVSADISSEKLNSAGVVMDFNRLKSILEEIVSRFNNRSLEEVEYFKKNGSSAEVVAKYVYGNLKVGLPARVKLHAVSVTEQPGCSAKYSE